MKAGDETWFEGKRVTVTSKADRVEFILREDYNNQLGEQS